eukprot:6201269-Pleurochrysis_carterae.AAC.2
MHAPARKGRLPVRRLARTRAGRHDWGWDERERIAHTRCYSPTRPAPRAHVHVQTRKCMHIRERAGLQSRTRARTPACFFG